MLKDTDPTRRKIPGMGSSRRRAECLSVRPSVIPPEFRIYCHLCCLHYSKAASAADYFHN
jgi:hypothetical protein